jgi:hypothetical protein
LASIINSTDTGSGGLITTGDSSDELQIQTAETTALTITSGQQSVFIAGTAAAPAVTTTGDLNTGIFFSAADTLVVTTGGTAAVTVDSGQRTKFPTTIGVGDATPSASGSGISFPATQSASSDANTLDDYEEGVFTPAIAFGGASVGITYTQQQGFYTKIGNLVTCQIRILLSNKGSSSGDATITGLPFTAAGGEAYSGVAGRISSMSFADTYGGFVNVSSTLIVLEEVTNAGSASSIASGDFTNGTNIIFTVSYRV